MHPRRFISAHLALLLAALLPHTPVAAAPPANDNFASPADLLAAATLSVAGTTVEATREAGEPIYVGSNRSVWYKWTAPTAGIRRVSVTSSSPAVGNDPSVTVFEGPNVTSLTPVGLDLPGHPYARFDAVASRVYFFHVLERGASGPFTLSLAAGTAPAPPANDNFINAATVTSALPRSVNGTFVDATLELREPNAYASTEGRATVWYKWTAPASASWIDVYLEGNAPSSGFRLYTGTTLANLTEFLPRYFDVSYPESYYQVTPSTTYHIQVYQREAANRAFSLNIDPIAAPVFPANDAFANRTSLGNAANVSRPEETSVDATTEPGETLPFTILTSTVWYSWTAPATGTFEFTTTGGANHDTFLCVYTGTTAGGLSLQACNDDIDFANENYDSKVVISTTANTVYQIQVGSAYAAQDTFALTIAPVDQDLLPFRITSFTTTPSTVDLTTAAATVTFDITLSALLEFPGDLTLYLEAPTATAPWGGIPANRILEGITPPVLGPGLTYRVTRTLPAGLPAGTYPIQVDIEGQISGPANDYPFYGGRAGATLPGGVTAVTVTNSGTVVAPPTLTSFTMTPATVDATLADVTVQLAANATGLPTTNDIELFLTDSLGLDAFFSEPLSHDGTRWTGSLTIPKGTRPGVFRPTLTLYGTALGRDYGFANPLATALPAGSPAAFTITNTTPDSMPPQLREFTLDQTTINLAAGDVLVGGTCRITDQNDLVDLQIGLDDGVSTLLPTYFLTQLSGDGRNGLYRWNMVIDHLTSSGSYSLLASMDDGRGNAISASPVFATWPVNLPATLGINGSAPDNAEVKWMALQDFSAIPETDDRDLSATAINADPDADGLPNLLEFHFGTNPAVPDNNAASGNLPVPARNGNLLQLDFGKSSTNAALGLPGSTLIGEFSTDLANWGEVPITATDGRFRIQSPALTPGPGYLRLRAKIP